MNKDNRIRSSINESLSSVHFDPADMHRVLHAVHGQRAVRTAPVRRRRPLRLIFATAMAALIIVPVSLLALRAGSVKPADITTIAAHDGATPTVTAQDPLISMENTPAPVLAGFTADDAIAVARACFEAHCDTTIFTFDEYTVDVQADYPYGEAPASHGYQVTMRSIYGNGCVFSVTVSASGEVMTYSAPQRATVPEHLSSSEEIRAWYDKYGEALYTWPLDVQAEFSRRYEGALLRAPREGDMSEEAILAIAREYARHHWETESPIDVCTSLMSERASGDGMARYQVYCFRADAPGDCLLLTIRAATGEIESSEPFTRDGF